ncbi:hypothetical protein SKAU_G00205470 [Synaphobranchus kaupii]|uniref:Uncharacterized protein n=1 Tax=Synaphobranchus kaupii TaxID=118154 RepID=A0A9Q1FGB3_SYNKA|nr:hypothetical protein SKAU_G00205470 [Synaphobranchus kaupii]
MMQKNRTRSGSFLSTETRRYSLEQPEVEVLSALGPNCAVRRRFSGPLLLPPLSPPPLLPGFPAASGPRHPAEPHPPCQGRNQEPGGCWRPRPHQDSNHFPRTALSSPDFIASNVRESGVATEDLKLGRFCVAYGR